MMARVNTTEVTCPAGTVLGVMDDGLRRFHSIPVVQASGLFDNPRPAELGLLIDATRPHPNAPHLSITAPAATAHEDLPVMVWIHGGRFEEGDHTETFSNPDGFAREGVVHVRVGYRLKFPGFVQFPDDTAAHYRAVADVSTALTWIQHNIEAFGGDPTNVTVMGHSAGAAIALWLCRRDHYKGEFRRVLAMSPAFPRRGFPQRKWAARGALGTPIARVALNRLSPTKLNHAYQRFRLHFPTDMALGPYPLEPQEMANVPVVLTCTDKEFHHSGAKLDRVPALGRVFVRVAGRTMGLRKRASKGAGKGTGTGTGKGYTAGQLLSDSLVRRHVDAVAEHAPGPVWLAEHVGYAHAEDLSGMFAPDPWLLTFLRTGDVGWPEYGVSGRGAVRRREAEAPTVVHDPLGYLRDIFEDPNSSDIAE